MSIIVCVGANAEIAPGGKDVAILISGKGPVIGVDFVLLKRIETERPMEEIFGSCPLFYLIENHADSEGIVADTKGDGREVDGSDQVVPMRGSIAVAPIYVLSFFGRPEPALIDRPIEGDL